MVWNRALSFHYLHTVADLFRKKQIQTSNNFCVELFQDPNMYNWIERNIRGGICVANHRYATANNPNVENFNPNLPTTNMRYFDANNFTVLQ